MCHKVTSKYAVYRNLGKLNYPVVCILWYMKNFKKHGRANWKPISWVKVDSTCPCQVGKPCYVMLSLYTLGERFLKQALPLIPLMITRITFLASASVRVNRCPETEMLDLYAGHFDLPLGWGTKNKVYTVKGPYQNTIKSLNLCVKQQNIREKNVSLSQAFW